MEIIDRTQGVLHFLFDKTPEDVRVLPPIWNQRKRETLVTRVRESGNIKEDIRHAVAGLKRPPQIIRRGDHVLVKPNYNSPDPPPASTATDFLRAAVEILLETGACVSIGDCSGAVWRPTRKVLEKTGVYDLGKQLGVPVYAFEDEGNEWVRVEISGRYLKWVTVPRIAYEADRIVYLPCLKTHRLAGFSGALKLAFGLVHPGERRRFHAGHLQQKLAEVNRWRLPDVVIMDGRKAFVTGGPNQGRMVEPGVILASEDPVALDIEATRVLIEHGADLPTDYTDIPQIAESSVYTGTVENSSTATE